MPKLNQILAVEKGVKNRTNTAITQSHHATQRVEGLSGISRTYQPKDEEGEQFPPESKRVQVTVKDELDKLTKAWTELINITATKDAANTLAKADLVVDGQTLATGVPAVTLLWLEHQAIAMKAVVEKLPVLSPDENWTYEPNLGAYVSEPVQTHKTKKVPRVLEKAKATDKHPAQVEVWQEDVVVGYWNTKKFSGAIEADRKAELLERVDLLIQATQKGREEANLQEAESVEIGAGILEYVFGGA